MLKKTEVLVASQKGDFMIRAGLTRWFQAPPVSGGLALLCGVALVAVPTLVRAAVNGVVTGCEFTPYLPFVLLAAILLPLRYAVLVALVSVGILGGLFVGSPNAMLGTCFVSSAGIFLASSAAMIFTIVLIRRLVHVMQARGADESEGGIVFSLDRGQVWASWYGQGPPVLLGSQRKVSEMMKDFLAQVELARRLNDR